jgi:hypothetical protein
LIGHERARPKYFVVRAGLFVRRSRGTFRAPKTGFYSWPVRSDHNPKNLAAPPIEGTAAKGIMPKYVIEREIPGAGNLSREQLQAISQKSCGVLREIGPRVQWLHSYVTDNKIYCVYIADNADSVREHARKGGFPANSVAEVRSTIDPVTAEAGVLEPA